MEDIKTIENLKNLFQKIEKCTKWSIYLLKIKKSQKNGIAYYTRQIFLKPEGTLTSIIGAIARYYVEGNNSLDKKYDRIETYDGVTIGNIIYRLSIDNNMISNEYNSLVSAIDSSNVEGKLKITDYQGYVICGVMDNKQLIRLISLQKPIQSYEEKKRFILEEASFKEIKGNVLQLRENVDAIIYNKEFYMMNLSAEKLFDIERSYRKKCENEVDNIIEKKLVSDSELFSSVALSGHNPRKFVSFSEENFEVLTKNSDMRKSIGEKFNIPLTKEGIFDTTEKKSCENLIKVLCKKAMLEPFGQEPMEVEIARTWK